MGRKRESTDRRIRRDLSRMGVGLLDVTGGASGRRAIERYHAVVDKLIEDSQVEALRALKERQLSLDELVDLDRRGMMTGTGVLAAVKLQRPFFAAWDAVAPRLASGRGGGAQRYAVTRTALERKGAPIIDGNTLVADLALPEKVDWRALMAQWGGSASDWMHVRRAVSRVLTVLLGDKYHPFRRQVVQLIPTLAEPSRVPDLSPERFWAVVKVAREDVRAAFVTLVATGMRVRSEYLRCTEANLKPDVKAVQVPGTKTEGSAAVVHVDPRLWTWVTAGIPATVQYKRLRELWVAACREAGVEGITLHDLRHCHGQWATDQGIALQRVADSLRHSNSQTTQRYARSTDTRAVSSAVADALEGGRADA